MSFDFTVYGIPPESYSRTLDERVAATEMPYGYDYPPPPADTDDYDPQARESKKEYRLKNGRAV